MFQSDSIVFAAANNGSHEVCPKYRAIAEKERITNCVLEQQVCSCLGNQQLAEVFCVYSQGIRAFLVLKKECQISHRQRRLEPVAKIHKGFRQLIFPKMESRTNVLSCPITCMSNKSISHTVWKLAMTHNLTSKSNYSNKAASFLTFPAFVSPKFSQLLGKGTLFDEFRNS